MWLMFVSKLWKSKVQVVKQRDYYPAFDSRSSHKNVGWLDDWNAVILKPQLQAVLEIFITDTVPFCSVQKLIFFIGPKVSFIDEQIYPPLGDQGRPAEWGSRWCRWVRKCYISSLMCCLTLGKYLCLCFFSYEISGAILTYLKSTVEFGVVSMGAVAIQLTLRSDWKMFSIQSATFL